MNTEIKQRFIGGKLIIPLDTLPLGYNATVLFEDEQAFHQTPITYHNDFSPVKCLACKKRTTPIRINDLPLCSVCVKVEGKANNG